MNGKEILKILEKEGTELDKWQKEVYDETEKNIIIKSGRQVGKTFTIGLKIVKEAVTRPKTTWMILSRTQRQSGHLFDHVKQLLRDLDVDLEDEPTMTRAKLSNGSIIYSLPSGWTGAGIRGYTLHGVAFEEAAYIPDEVFTTVRPMIATTNGQMIMLSTPNGPQGYFYNTYHDKSYRRWNIPSKMCTRIPLSFLREEKKRMSKVEYQREYEGRFTHVQDGLIDIELIQRQMERGKAVKCNPTNIHFIGLDIARFGKADTAAAFCEYNRSSKKSHICRVDVIKGKKRTTHVMGYIVRMMEEKYYKIKKIIVDETGVGGGVVDVLVERFGKRRILGINNASRPIDQSSEGRRRKFIKEDLYSNLIRMLEKDLLTLDDDINILRSLRNVRFEYTSKGTLKIFGPDHDIAEAIVRAIFPMMFKNIKKPFVIGMSNQTKEERLYDTMHGDRRIKDNIIRERNIVVNSDGSLI